MRAPTGLVAAATLTLVALALAACGSSSRGSVSGGVVSSHQYELTSIDDCLAFNYTSDDYSPVTGSGFTGNTKAAEAAYKNGEGAFSSDNFPPSAGGGATFYGFSSARAAQTAMLNDWKDGASTLLWRVGNIIVEGVPVKLPSVEATALAHCFGGTLDRVMAPHPAVHRTSFGLKTLEVAFAPDGRHYAYTISDPSDPTKQRIVVVSGDLKQTLPGVNLGAPNAGLSMAWAPDSRHLAAVVDEGATAPPTAEDVVVIDTKNPATRAVRLAHIDDPGSISNLSFSPDGGEVLFDSFDGSSDATIWVSSLASEHPSPIKVADHAMLPTWSSDGTRFVFVEGHIAMVARSDGSAVRPIASNVVTAAWSPTSDEIAVTTSTAIRILTPDGTQIRSFPWTAEYSLTWTADGRYVAAFGNNGWWLIDSKTGARTPVPALGFSSGPRTPLRTEYCDTNSADQGCTAYVTPGMASAWIDPLASTTILARLTCAGEQMLKLKDDFQHARSVVRAYAEAGASGTVAAAGAVAGEASLAALELAVGAVGDKIGEVISGTTPACETNSREVEAALQIAQGTQIVHSHPDLLRDLKVRTWFQFKRQALHVGHFRPNLCRWRVEVNDTQVMDVKYAASSNHCP
jgi:hypothetical protein